MENYEFRIGELEVQNEELLAELNVIYFNAHDLIHTVIKCFAL